MDKSQLESIHAELAKIRHNELTVEVVIEGLKETIKHILNQAITNMVQQQKDSGNNRIIRAMSPTIFHTAVDEAITFCLMTWVSLELDLTFDEIDSLPLIKNWTTRFIDQQLKEQPVGMRTIHQIACSVAGMESFDDNDAVWRIVSKLSEPIPDTITHMGWQINRIKNDWIAFKVTAEVWNASTHSE